jgi:hypothetical protein
MYFRDCKTLSVFERKIPLTVKKHASQGIVKKKRTKPTKQWLGQA